jgi:hypothetical protein
LVGAIANLFGIFSTSVRLNWAKGFQHPDDPHIKQPRLSAGVSCKDRSIFDPSRGNDRLIVNTGEPKGSMFHYARKGALQASKSGKNTEEIESASLLK